MPKLEQEKSANWLMSKEIGKKRMKLFKIFISIGVILHI
ncbi:unnamed protein product, partial [marine sediment metagenome]